MNQTIRVTKRDGTLAPSDYNKIHFVLEEACEGLSDVSVSDIELNAAIQFYDGIKTTDIHEILIRSANELITETTPNYEIVAARLINYCLRKTVFGDYITPPLIDVITKNVDLGIYDPTILDHYSKEEINKLDSHIDHKRDELFKSAGLQQCIDKYLLKDRNSSRIHETPQYMYMLISMTVFKHYSRYGNKVRMKYVKSYYDAISKFEINIPTPVMSGARTKVLQYASCVKIDIDDTMESITHCDSAIKMYTSQRAGIGINGGRIRSIGSSIRNGDVVHTGVIPFLKCFEASVKCCTQNGVRGGCYPTESTLIVLDSVIIDGVVHAPEDKILVGSYESIAIDVLNNTLDVLNNSDVVMQVEARTKRVRIDEVEVGQYVLSYDHDQLCNDYKKITEVFFPTVEYENQARIDFRDGQFIVTSDTHRMWVGSKGNWDYVETKDIKVGDSLLSSDNVIKSVALVTIGKQTEETRYRDLTIEGNHNYFVAANEIGDFILGHNSATVHFPFWHEEIGDIIVLKNNKGVPENRVRRLDYSIQLNRLFYRRFIANQDITLFSPHNVPGLYEVMGNNDEFEKLYEQYEKNPLIAINKINARELFINITKERVETGRIYLMNMDHCNQHSSFTIPIHMSNLCQEITLPTKPIQYFEDENGEIALCILSAINLGKIDVNKLHDQMRVRCDLVVRSLDELIDIQKYPLKAAQTSTLKRRSLGVGYIGLAHFLAKQRIHYGSQQAIDLVHRVTESLQYHLIDASIELAKIKGPCEGLMETKYGHGILPIDTYTKALDEVCSVPLDLDWECLRTRLKEHGIRNSTLTAQMPSESSSVVSNETNGIEVPKEAIQNKRSKVGTLKLLVPEYKKYKEFYTFTFDDNYSNDSYIKQSCVIQKFFDQAISNNQNFNPAHYPDKKIPIKVVMQNIILGYSLGQKTAYYFNTDDGKDDKEEVTPQTTPTNQIEVGDGDCDSGACAI